MISDKTKSMQNAQSLRTEAGFSLVEIMVALTLFLIVSGAIFGLLKIAGSDRFSTNQRVEMIQNLRVAMSAIERDALDAAAGQFPRGGAQLPKNSLSGIAGAKYPVNVGISPDLLTPIIAVKAVNPNTLSGINTDEVTLVYRDQLFNSGQAMSLQSLTASGSGYQAVLGNPNSLSPAPNNNASDVQDGVTNYYFRQNDLYWIGGVNAHVVGVMTNTRDGSTNIYLNSGDPLNLNRTSSTGGVIQNAGATSVAISRIIMVRYRVLNDGTLVRTVYGYDQTNSGNATAQHDEPLAYNITNLQCLYTMSDKTTTTNPAASALGYAGIRQVSISLTARSPQIDPRTGQPLTASVTNTFAVRNISYQ